MTAEPDLRLMPTRREWAAAAIGVVFAAVFTVLLPPLEAPDEPAHLAYANFIAARGELPNQYDPERAVYGQGHQAPLYYVVASVLVRAVTDDGQVTVEKAPNAAHQWHGGSRLDVPLFVEAGPAFPSASRARG
jgi:hypothetical protein